MSASAEQGETIALRDGRQLGYLEFGTAEGWPILYCHGMPGSRFEPLVFSAEARRLGLRIIGLDRPGYGRTSPLPDRMVGDEVPDVISLVDHLRLERFDVIGFSGGGPPALACAARLPDRVRRMSLVSSWAPFDEAGLDGMLEGYHQLWGLAGSDFPAFEQALGNAITEAGGGYQLLVSGAPESDRAILEQPEFAQPYKQNLDEALHQDLEGMLEDAAAMISTWRFECREVCCPTLISHGQMDGNAPIGMGRWLVANLPGARLTEWPDAMHFEAFRRWSEILAPHAER